LQDFLDDTERPGISGNSFLPRAKVVRQRAQVAELISAESIVAKKAKVRVLIDYVRTPAKS
jgi:hypothetical protein